MEHAFKNNSSGMVEEQEIKILGPHLYGAISSTNLIFGNLMKVKLISIFLAASNVICILLTHGINLRKKASRCTRWEESREQRSRLKGLQLEKHVLETGMIQCAGWISSIKARSSTQLTFLDRKFSPHSHVHCANTTSSSLLPGLCTCFPLSPESPPSPLPSPKPGKILLIFQISVGILVPQGEAFSR